MMDQSSQDDSEKSQSVAAASETAVIHVSTIRNDVLSTVNVKSTDQMSVMNKKRKFSNVDGGINQCYIY